MAEGALVRMTLKEGEIDFEIEVPELVEAAAAVGDEGSPESLSA